jgi:hypothetical protein
LEKVDSAEMSEWIAFFKIRNDEIKEQEKKAKQEANRASRKGRRH